MANKAWRIELKIDKVALYVVSCLAPSLEEAIVMASRSAEDAGHTTWSLGKCTESESPEVMR